MAVCAALCKQADTIIEVGANVGTETVCFADIVGPHGQVFALEPDEENYRALVRMVELNGFSNVHVVRCAAGDREGTVQFEPTPDRGMSGLGFVREEGSSSGLAVEVRRLDWWYERGLTKVDAVFIDVEGYEPAVLRGATGLLLTSRPVMVLEASPPLLERSGSSLKDLSQQLSQLRYQCFTIGRFGLEACNLRTRRAENWLCLPVEKAKLAEKVQLTLQRAGWMPMIRGLNPLARR